MLGSAVALMTLTALTAVMVPLRSQLNVATTALVLVIPVVAAVATGGLLPGVMAVISGFLVFDFFFILPYYSLDIGTAQDWVALGVYTVVMLVTAQVVARLDAARADAQLRADVTQRLFELSELLVADKSVAELIETIVMTVWQAFDLEGAALLLPIDGRLRMVASVGAPLSEEEQQRLASTSSVTVTIGATSGGAAVRVVALSAAGRPIGLLALRGVPQIRANRDLLRTFANHLALALERAQLRDQAVRARLLEESDRWRRSLVGAVSHDLRTPLATIKVASSSLRDPAAHLSAADSAELAALIDDQTDRLDRLVANLLDMTRIQTGGFQLRREPVALQGLMVEALASLGQSVGPDRIQQQVAEDLPSVDVDPVLVVQVLINLMDNAARYSPEGSPIVVAAQRNGDEIEVSVSDQGPGVDPDERDTIFQMFNHREAGGRAGLGLAIVKAFVEAHDRKVWVEQAAGGGARFVFSLPAAVVPAEAA